MEEIKALRLKEKILLIELKAIQQKIALYDESLETTVNSVQETARLQTESIPLQTAKGKEISSPLIPDALGKSMKRSNDEPQSSSTPDALGKSMKWSNDEPQSSSSPVANGSGKDSSNPLMADSLPKTDKVVLRPTYSQIMQEPMKSKSRFYVIFDGEHRGIYEDWSIVSRYVTGTSCPFKKFGSLLQAQQEATRYSAEFGKKEIPLRITVFSEPLKPKKKERMVEFKKEKDFLKNIKEAKEEEEDNVIISLDEFRLVWSKARLLSHLDFESEHIYIEDKATKSLIIFCPGASPELVSLAFYVGLTKYIYPSANLLEISLLSEGMKKAIKNFRRKIADARDANIFIKCNSTLPDWYQGRSFPSYHHLEIGIAKTRTVEPSKVMAEKYEDPENWVEIRSRGFMKILNNLQKITAGSFVKVNYCSTNCIITGHSGSPIPKHEKELLTIMERRILLNETEVGPTTKENLCQKLQRIIEDHQCAHCKASSTEETSLSKDCFMDEDK
uniref:Transactivator/viroplasmin protein n=1 Tax=Dahlia mosaic virus TaxID=213888 RepID=A9UD04_DMV|nr:inclusion body protein [Dahlia mosaic virus]